METTSEHPAQSLGGASIFDGYRIVNLVSFKRSGQGVSTPVWFAQDRDTLYIRTRATSGKVKRFRNDPHVQLATCDPRGILLAEGIRATARLAEDGEAHHANQLLNHKYGLAKVGFDAAVRLQGKTWAVFAVDVSHTSMAP